MPPLVRTSVLLVEDNDDHAFLFSRAFSEHPGVRLDRVCDGLEAKAYLRGRPARREGVGLSQPSALITDLNMPRCGGVELIQWLRSSEEWAGLPIVVVSSSIDQIDMDRCYAVGAQAFLIKPTTCEGFRHLVDCLVRLWQRYGVLGAPSSSAGEGCARPWSSRVNRRATADPLQPAGRAREEA